jgi:4-carboxymuconolactone decarboxylase
LDPAVVLGHVPAGVLDEPGVVNGQATQPLGVLHSDLSSSASVAIAGVGAVTPHTDVVPSYGAFADTAVSAGASATDIVGVLIGLIPVVGVPRVVAAAPKLAFALGHDIDELLHPADGWLSAGRSDGDGALHSVTACDLTGPAAGTAQRTTEKQSPRPDRPRRTSLLTNKLSSVASP